MNGVYPQAWLTNVFSRMTAHPGAGVHRLRRRGVSSSSSNPQGIDADRER
jgi:hypothetical protein